MGFAKDHYGQFVIVVQQPYVIGDPITEDERVSFMHDLGFEDAGMDYGMHLNYMTKDLYIGDINEFPEPLLDFTKPYSEWLTYM